MATRWSDGAFLDEIRRHVDPQADASVARVFAEGGAAGSAALFRHTTSNDDQLPVGSPPALVEFFQETRPLPPGTDLARVARGEFVWMKNAFRRRWCCSPSRCRRATRRRRSARS
jgi:hypothetical protein